jgi:hypothetical protein
MLKTAGDLLATLWIVGVLALLAYVAGGSSCPLQ